MRKAIMIALLLGACSQKPEVNYHKVNQQPLAPNSSMAVDVELPYKTGDELADAADELLSGQLERRLRTEPTVDVATSTGADYEIHVTIEDVDVGLAAAKDNTIRCVEAEDDDRYTKKLAEVLCEQQNYLKEQEAVAVAAKQPLQIRALSTQTVLIDSSSGRELASYNAWASGGSTGQTMENISKNIVEGALCHGEDCS